MSVGLRNQYLITLNWSPIFCTLSSVGFWLLDIQKLTREAEHLWKWAPLTILPLWCKSCKSLLMMFIECSFLPGSHSTKGFKIIQRKYRHFVCVLVTQSCLILCNPMDYSPPDSSVHGTFQARVLEWGAIAFSSDVYWVLIFARIPLYQGF